jgi:hypothetical protein
MDVRSPSAATPFLDRQHSHDVVRSHEPPVAERHHADVGNPHNVFLAHVHIVANICSIQRSRPQRVHPYRVDRRTAEARQRRGQNHAFAPVVDPARPAQTHGCPSARLPRQQTGRRPSSAQPRSAARDSESSITRDLLCGCGEHPRRQADQPACARIGRLSNPTRSLEPLGQPRPAALERSASRGPGSESLVECGAEGHAGSSRFVAIVGWPPSSGDRRSLPYGMGSCRTPVMGDVASGPCLTCAA